MAESIQDKELWERLQNGEKVALKLIYEKYFDVLYSYGLKLSGKSENAEDAIHELFVDLWKYRFGLNFTTSIEFYLYRSLRRKLHSMKKLEVRGLHIDKNEYLLNREEESTIEFRLISQERSDKMSKILDQCLQKLPIRQRESLMLRFYGELSYKEIAGVLNINEQSARNLIQRGLDCMRKVIHPPL